MRTYQDIEKDIKFVSEQTANLAFMTKEQIYGVVASLISISDELNSFIHELDIKIAESEQAVHAEAAGEKMTASMLNLRVRGRIAPYKADRDWADRQVLLLRDLRIAALAAQRSAES